MAVDIFEIPSAARNTRAYDARPPVHQVPVCPPVIPPHNTTVLPTKGRVKRSITPWGKVYFSVDVRAFPVIGRFEARVTAAAVIRVSRAVLANKGHLVYAPQKAPMCATNKMTAVAARNLSIFVRKTRRLNQTRAAIWSPPLSHVAPPPYPTPSRAAAGGGRLRSRVLLRLYPRNCRPP